MVRPAIRFESQASLDAIDRWETTGWISADFRINSRNVKLRDWFAFLALPTKHQTEDLS